MKVVVRWVVAVGAAMTLTACAQGVTGTAAVGTGLPSTTAAATVTSTAATSTAAPSSTRSSPTSGSAPTGTGAAGDTSVPDSSAPLTLASGVTIEELADDIDAAQNVVDGYWSTHWSDFFTGAYTPPTVVGLYDGEDPGDTPTCDGEPLESYNAVYCIPEDYVAWDANLLVTGADAIGDSWVYLVIAHEWGHAVQARLDSTLVPESDELQADCLGAAALYGAVADGTLEFEEGDETELIGSLSALADQMAWTMSSDHGDAFQRVDWFTLGRNGGVEACLAAAESAPTTS